MTNKEAIEILRHYTNLGYGIVIEGEDTSKIVQALSFASKALEERQQGEWIPQGGGFSWVFKCSCCSWVDGYPFNERHKYCPNCGAEMKGDTSHA